MAEAIAFLAVQIYGPITNRLTSNSRLTNLLVFCLCAARVGKTSLSTKFVNNSFDKQQSSTVDATYLEKTVQVGQKRVKLVIWDTAGQEKYHALAKIYY